jgi:predicted secreted hydrolase
MATLISLPFGMAGGGEKNADGYRIPGPHPTLRFPADHGSHPGFRIEWWYLTGHLFSGERRFGMQSTFFRLAQRPNFDDAGRAFGDSQMYLAHFALTDVEGGRFLHEERLNRQGWDADAAVGDLHVRNGNWSLKRLSGLESLDGAGSMRLIGGVRSEALLDLELSPSKPAVVFGADGVSRKGDEPSAASLYITFPRLTVSGSLRLGGIDLPVKGEVWMDHEVSSSQLGREQVGWDWVSAQFFDSSEVMAYVLRKPDGSPDRHSTLAWIDAEGRVTHLKVDEFIWEPDGIWESAGTGGRYPIRPRFGAVDPQTGRERRFSLRPVMDGQEMTGGLGGVAYWEGACDVLDESGIEVGRAYLELTGYTGDDLQKRLRGG